MKVEIGNFDLDFAMKETLQFIGHPQDGVDHNFYVTRQNICLCSVMVFFKNNYIIFIYDKTHTQSSCLVRLEP